MSLFHPQPSLFDQDRLTTVRKDKVAVKQQGSSLTYQDWRPATCTRCGHPIDLGHRPGKTARCRFGHCTCLYAKVTCTCGHQSDDHESWGVERSTGCGRCGCAKFAPTPSNATPPTGGQ